MLSLWESYGNLNYFNVLADFKFDENYKANQGSQILKPGSTSISLFRASEARTTFLPSLYWENTCLLGRTKHMISCSQALLSSDPKGQSAKAKNGCPYAWRGTLYVEGSTESRLSHAPATVSQSLPSTVATGICCYCASSGSSHSRC